jgi:hypothetical protein
VPLPSGQLPKEIVNQKRGRRRRFPRSLVSVNRALRREKMRNRAPFAAQSNARLILLFQTSTTPYLSGVFLKTSVVILGEAALC